VNSAKSVSSSYGSELGGSDAGGGAPSAEWRVLEGLVGSRLQERGSAQTQTLLAARFGGVHIQPTVQNPAADRYNEHRRPSGLVSQTAGGQQIELWGDVHVPAK
jgi:hypothetical protein